MTQDTLDKANSLREGVDMAENLSFRLANPLDCARIFLIDGSCFDPLGSKYSAYLTDREKARIRRMLEDVLMIYRKAVANRVTELKDRFKSL